MPKYLIKETMPCWVTWHRVVEADDEVDAYNCFNDGDGVLCNADGSIPVDGEPTPEIGDILSGYDGDQTIVAVMP